METCGEGHCPKCGANFSGTTTCIYCKVALVPMRVAPKSTCPKCGAAYDHGTHCMYCKVALTRRVDRSRATFVKS